MTEVHIDTNIYSGAMAGDETSIHILQSVGRVYISTIVIGELLSGFKVGEKGIHNRRLLDKFLDSPRVRIAEIGEKTAEHYSNIFRELRKSGKPISTNDMWIAAGALERGVPLATVDQHFEWVPGLILA